jgi:hypothetical protein
MLHGFLEGGGFECFLRAEPIHPPLITTTYQTRLLDDRC